MYKFLRYYTMDIEASDGEIITVSYPISLDFNVNRNTLSSANTGSFQLYNLSEKNRQKLRFNVYEAGEVSRKITVRAGYQQNNLSVIFRGVITSASSHRDGVTFVTDIEANDGGIALSNAQIPPGVTFPAGTPNLQVISKLVDTLSEYGVEKGRIGSFPGVTDRAKTYEGYTIKVLNELTKGACFIDGQIANCLNNNEVLKSTEISTINSQNGLLGSPVLEKSNLTFDMIFEPRLRAGQLINLESTVISTFNGQKKVTSIAHYGTISGAICGDAITSVGMLYFGKLTPV